MKKVLFFVVASILFAGQAWAAGSWTISDYLAVKNKVVMELTWVADSSNGSVPEYEVTSGGELKEYWLTQVYTDPGATAPTALYDIVINDSYGDIMGGGLANRSATATERAEVVIPYSEDWTIVITNNSVNSATGKIVLTFVK